MTRPTAAYIGIGLLSHPVRLVIPRRLQQAEAVKLMSLAEAAELIADLASAVARAEEERARKERPAPPGAA
jgi:uncharacterized small protein (DUF1192 family)